MTKKIVKNFWGYSKEVFEKEDTVKPGFIKEACYSFFTKTWSLNLKLGWKNWMNPWMCLI